MVYTVLYIKHVPELIPRVLLEASLLRCRGLLELPGGETGGDALKRLTAEVRGVGDGRVAARIRAYLVNIARKGELN